MTRPIWKRRAKERSEPGIMRNSAERDCGMTPAKPILIDVKSTAVQCCSPDSSSPAPTPEIVLWLGPGHPQYSDKCSRPLHDLQTRLGASGERVARGRRKEESLCPTGVSRLPVFPELANPSHRARSYSEVGE